MRVLLIGGTGNLSADCAELLHRQGHEVCVLTRGGSEVPEGYRRVLADRKDAGGFAAALEGCFPDVVINFLGFGTGDVELDHGLFAGRVRQYVFISSATVYAKPHGRLPLTEESPLGNPYWEYAQKKQACEAWLMQRFLGEGFPVTIVRPSHTYSHRWVPNPVSSASFTYALRIERGLEVIVPDEGLTPWTLTSTRDFAVGLAGLVGNEEAVGEAFHITSEEAMGWKAVMDEVASAFGVESARVVGVPTDWVQKAAPELYGPWKGDKANPAIFDNSKIKRFVPEFECRVSFREGVRESIAWLRAHPEQQNLKPEIDVLCERLAGAQGRRS
ncbi:MAG: hypothetical protein RI897_1985 [Verrucomicrobiota bacterium]|jgi:nucleoside-diphosphate-sugar epimerase